MIFLQQDTQATQSDPVNVLRYLFHQGNEAYFYMFDLISN